MTYFLHRRRGETLAETMIENRREPAITTSLWWFTLVYSQRLSVVCGDLLWCIHSDSVLRVVIYFGVFTAIESCVVIYFGVFTAIQWCVVIYSGVFTAIQCCVWWFILVYSQQFSAVCGDLLWCIHSDSVLSLSRNATAWCSHSDSAQPSPRNPIVLHILSDSALSSPRNTIAWRSHSDSALYSPRNLTA